MIFSEITIPQPLLDEANCTVGQLGCADGTCLPQDYFCDGSQDCPDASDEAECDIFSDPNGAQECDWKSCKLPNCFCSKDGKFMKAIYVNNPKSQGKSILHLQ